MADGFAMELHKAAEVISWICKRISRCDCFFLQSALYCHGLVCVRNCKNDQHCFILLFLLHTESCLEMKIVPYYCISMFFLDSLLDQFKLLRQYTYIQLMFFPFFVYIDSRNMLSLRLDSVVINTELKKTIRYFLFIILVHRDIDIVSY